MTKSSVFLFFLVFFMINCESNQLSYNHDGKQYITDQSSFNSETGELKTDQHTVTLWHFNEGEDIILFDGSQFENYGFIESREYQLNWQPGMFGQAFMLNGKDNYIEIQHSDSLSPKDAVTIEMWIYINPRQFHHYPSIISKDSVARSSGSPVYELFLSNEVDSETSTNLCWRITTDHGEITLNSDLDWYSLTQQWHYLAAVYDGLEMKLYIDGNLLKSRKTKGKLSKNKMPVKISRKWNPKKNYFHGIIDELRISNIGRSEKAIKKYWLASKRIIQ